jgi:cytochrome c biogenesis protein CcmG/thiol:disulfide interchange protein DsbE
MRVVLRVVACVAIASAVAGSAAASPRALLHKPAPQFARNDLQHRTIDLRAYRGKVVLLTYWATWCAPCQMEIPRFVDWQRTLGPRGFEVIAVSMDDDAGPVTQLMKRRNVNYPVVMGDARLAKLYGGILGLPVNFLIDRKGTVQAVWQGESNLESMHARILEMLRVPEASGTLKPAAANTSSLR